MVAYFSSIFRTQVFAALTAAILAICVLGTNWIGFSHSISHAHIQVQADTNSIADESLPSLNHSSDVCHLFDALTLAGFIASKFITGINYSNFSHQSNGSDTSLIARESIECYQSRAPPTFLL